MVEILFPATSRPGFKPTEGGGRLINAFAEPLGDGAKSPLIRRRVPGLSRAATSALFRCRALHLVGDTLIAAFTGHATTVNLETGVITSQGALAGDDRITIASNNAASPNIVAVTALGAFNLFTGSAPTAFADADLPANPTSVTFQDGYFFFSYADGRIFASGLNAVTVDALHFTTYQESPGGVTRLVPFRGDLLAMGPKAVGVYQNTANPTGFPYSFVDTIGKGLIAKFAVAGWQDGWMDELLWVGDDNVVYHLEGYSPVPVSTPDVVRSIQAVADKDDLDAIVYMNGAHAIWAISGPDFTWEFNISTGQWNERRSHGSDRWRAQCSIAADAGWIVGAVDTGHLYRISDTRYTEDGEPLVVELWSTPIADFPNRVAFPKADFDVTVGHGEAEGEDPIETTPLVWIDWSNDGGNTFSTPVLREIGGEGHTRQRVNVLRSGLSGPQGRIWRLKCSDPVYFSIHAGAQAAVPREG